MELTIYQKNILDFFKNHRQDNIYINAKAGCGKSFIAAKMLENVEERSIYVAFNKSIANEMKEKITNNKVQVSTLHSLCYSILIYNLEQKINQNKKGIGTQRVGNVLDNFKIYNIVNEILYSLSDVRYDVEYKAFLIENYVKMYNLIRLKLVSLESWSEARDNLKLIIKEQGLFFHEEYKEPDINTIYTILRKIDEKSLKIFEEEHKIDFTDMLYITYLKLSSKEWEVPGWNYYQNIIIDECLPTRTFIDCEGDENKNYTIYGLYRLFIKNKPLPRVKSFNHATQKIEYKNIKNVKYNGKREVFRIVTEGLNVIKATSNHKFYTQRGYVATEDLVIGKDCLFLDGVQNQKTKYVPNDDQLQLILASSIGDGYLSKMSDFNTYRLAFTQGDAQYNYFQFKKKMLNCCNERKIVSGYTGKETINQCSSKVFALFGDKWELMKNLDERFLSIWYQDDGSYFPRKNDKHIGYIRIACNNLNLEQIEYLNSIIKNKYDIEGTPKLSHNKYYNLCYNGYNSKKFLKLISKYMNEDCAYKNPYYNKKDLYEWDNNFQKLGCNFIKSIESVGIEKVYDMEVEDNHNFFCRVARNTKGVVHSSILTHNCQDLSVIQLCLLKFLKRKTGRYAYIGDFRQAIYNFAGANAYSCQLIKKMYAPIKEFDLPVNYRCAKTHLDYVNKHFDIGIQASPFASEGKIKTINKEKAIKLIQAGDFVVGRKNKWLLPIALELIKVGKPVCIKDETLVKDIVNFVEKFKSNDLFDLERKVKNKINKLDKKIKNTKEEKIAQNDEDIIAYAPKITLKKDKVTVVEAEDRSGQLEKYIIIKMLLDTFKDQYTTQSKVQFLKYIKEMLNTIPSDKCINITSIHCVKGLEATNVFVLNEGKVVIDGRMSVEQKTQEYNLSYVALTRAKENLYLIKPEGVEYP